MTDLSPDQTPQTPAQQILPATIDALPRDTARAPQTQFTRALQARFLRRLADCGEVRVAAKTLAVSHQTVYRMRRACPVFARGWDAALIVARERAEEMLASRAMHGVEEKVFYHGEVVATRRRYDSRLLLAHLARLDRLAERADMAALDGHFDAVVEAFEEAGEDAGEEGEVDIAHLERAPEAPGGSGECSQCGEAPTGAGARTSGATEGRETSSGPCNTWSKSRSETGGEGEDEGGAPDITQALSLEERLCAMEDERPTYAPTPLRLAQEIADSPDMCGVNEEDVLPDAGMIEAAQLAAFEAGEEEWWWVIRDGRAEGGGA